MGIKCGSNAEYKGVSVCKKEKKGVGRGDRKRERKVISQIKILPAGESSIEFFNQVP